MAVKNTQGPWRRKVLALARPYHMEPFRKYHDWDHPVEMIERADDLGVALDDAQFLGIAMHDLFCVAGAPSGFNETASKLAMQAHARVLGTDQAVTDAASAIIDLTAHGYAPEVTEAQAVVLDLDLMRLADLWAAFEVRNEDVHFEYAGIVPDRATFMRHRAHFLSGTFGESGIGARRVFRTTLFDEAAAQANIRRMIETYG